MCCRVGLITSASYPSGAEQQLNNPPLPLPLLLGLLGLLGLEARAMYCADELGPRPTYLAATLELRTSRGSQAKCACHTHARAHTEERGWLGWLGFSG